jgi:hypothetical protein
MKETQADPIARIVKLVDTVNHLAESLASTAATDVRQTLRCFLEGTHWKSKQFEFELRTELKRLAADSGLMSEQTDMNLQTAFEKMLESYRQALAGHLTAHARAMITRQFQEMRIAYDEFATLCKAA